MEALEQLVLIWAAVFVSVIAARKTRLTPVLYYLFAGFVLVNVGLLPEEPDEFLRHFAELGIIVIMFTLGFEENTSDFVQSAKRSWGIAFFGALAPFVVAYAVAQSFWGNPSISLLCGLAMTATAVSLTMACLKSEGLAKTPSATRIMSSALLDDIASLVLVAVMIPMVTGDTVPNTVEIAAIIAKALAFFVFVWVAAAWILPHEPEGLARHVPLLGSIGIKHLLSFEGGRFATLGALIVAVGTGIIAGYFGLHPAIGAYMGGLILHEEYFHGEADESSYRETRRILDNVAFSWIGPVFFVLLGTEILFDWDIVVSVLPETAMMTIGILVGQVLSAGLAARFTSGMQWPEAMLIGLGMLGRAELAFIVMDIAYVQNSILTTEAFYTLMFSAFFLNVSVPIGINLWKRRFASAV